MRTIKVISCITLLLIMIFTLRALAENTVTLDPTSGNYIIKYQSLDPAIGQVTLIYELPTRVKAVVVPDVKFKLPDTFAYRYEVRNLKESLQKIQMFVFPSLPPITSITRPDDFFGKHQTLGGAMIWGSFESKFDIGIGKSKHGFGFQSEGLPEIVKAEIIGTPRIDLRFPDEPPSDIREQLLAIDIKEENRYVLVQTVAPGALPGNLTLSQLLDRLMGLKHQAFQLGWVDNKGVANSLNKKLDAAKKKLEKGDTKTASNILHAFLHELQAQHEEEKETTEKREEKQEKKKWWEFWKRPKRQEARETKGGKHINDNAFYLLKANVEFLLFKLEARSR